MQGQAPPDVQQHRPWHRAVVPLLVFAAFVGLVCVVHLLSSKDSTDIDINSGRLRHRTTVFGRWVVAEEIEETAFSTFAEEIGIRTGPAIWHPVMSRTVWNRISPHYNYHGAERWLEQFMVMGEAAGWDENEKRDLAIVVAGLLRSGDIDAIQPIANDLGLRASRD